MSRAVFRRAFYKLAPSWLTSGEGELVWYSLGVMMDAFAERARQGLLARFPEYAPADALPLMSRDRRIIRGRNESDEAFAARVLTWLDDHRTRGNPFALMRQIRAYCGVPMRTRTVDCRGNWYTIEADGTTSVALQRGNWDWDGEGDARWSRFWVVLYPPSTLWTAGPNWGDVDLWGGAWGTDGYTWGTTATPDDVASVRAIVRDWKPAGTRCERIIIAFDDTKFDPTSSGVPPMPDGTWGTNAKLVGGVWVSTREPSARYWVGT